MKTQIIAALAGAIMTLATPALATTIVNQDSKEHTVRVDRGVHESEQKVAAGATARVDCPERCGFTVEGSGYGREPTDDAQLVITKEGKWGIGEQTR